MKNFVKAYLEFADTVLTAYVVNGTVPTSAQITKLNLLHDAAAIQLQVQALRGDGVVLGNLPNQEST